MENENNLINEDNNTLRLLKREDWKALEPKAELTDLISPIDRVIIGHAATDECTTQEQCTARTRYMQVVHMELRHFDDIGYNFLIGGDGIVYEGRGWNKQGAHTKRYNENSIGIVFIGTFNTITPPERQLNALKLLLEEGVRSQKLTDDYKLYGQCQFAPSESPGEILYGIIKTWPHWHNDPFM